MKRFWIVSLVVVLSAALAIPAFAEHDLGGFYRAKGWLSNYQQFNFGNIVQRGLTNTDPPTNAYVEQRARFKFNFSNNEWAKAVFYIEADNVWGDSQFNRNGTNRNTGGGLGADTVAIEIKNLYTWFQIPDTEFKFQVGLQNFNDAYYGNFLGVNDTGGIIGWYKTGSTAFRFGWLKFSEQFTSGSATNGTSRSDDADLYLIEVKPKFTEELDLGLNLYFYDDNRNRAGNQGGGIAFGTPTIPGGSTTDIYIIGANGTYKLDAVTLSGFLAFQTGTVNSNVAGLNDRDITALGLNLRGDFKLADGTAFVEGIWLSGDDNSADNDIEGWQVSPGINAPFYYRADTKIMFYNGDNLTTATAMFGDGNQSGNVDGRGVIAIMFGYKQNIADNWVGKIGLGYGMDAEGNSAAAGTLDAEEKSIFEINGYLNYLVTKGLTVGVYGAWGFLSDVPAANDPTRTQEADDLYQAYWRLNYSF